MSRFRACRCVVAAVLVVTACTGTSTTGPMVTTSTTVPTTAVAPAATVGASTGADASAEPVASTPAPVSGQASEVAQRVAVPLPVAAVRAPARDVALIGDSIMSMGATLADRALTSAGWMPAIDARSGRRVAGSTTPALTGAAAIDAIRQRHMDPHVWLVALGTNDLGPIARCRCDQRAAARDLVRGLLDRIGPDHVVYWITVRDWAYLHESESFNDVLRELVDDGSMAGIIDWWQASADAQDTWFVDTRHLSSSGYGQWRDLIAAALSSPS